MDKLKLGAIGEKLKTSGAQMGKMVSGKMKDLLQAQTIESKLVDEATSENLEEPNWGMNLRICGMLNSEEFSGPEVMKAIKKKISGKSFVSQRLSFDLLEACAMNCEKVFSEIASEKVLEEMVKMIDNPHTVHENRMRALQLIRAWGESEDLVYLTVFRQIYDSLEARGPTLAAQDGNSAFPSLGSHINQQPLAPPANYPISDMDLHDIDDDTVIFPRASHSAEEKKEFLVTTRNSVELLSTLLNAEEPVPIEDDLTFSMLAKCKEAQPVIRRMIESIENDEAMLFEVLNLNDEIQQVFSKYEEILNAVKIKGKSPESCETAGDSSPVEVDTVDKEKTNVSKEVSTESDNIDKKRAPIQESIGMDNDNKHSG